MPDPSLPASLQHERLLELRRDIKDVAEAGYPDSYDLIVLIDRLAHELALHVDGLSDDTTTVTHTNDDRGMLLAKIEELEAEVEQLRGDVIGHHARGYKHGQEDERAIWQGQARVVEKVQGGADA